MATKESHFRKENRKFSLKMKTKGKYQGQFPSITALTNHVQLKFSRERGSKVMSGMLHLRSA